MTNDSVEVQCHNAVSQQSDDFLGRTKTVSQMTMGETTKELKDDRLSIEIVTLFPGYFEGALRESIIGRGIQAQLFEIRIINLRDFGLGKHRTVDDTPFGGGGGMTLMPEPLVNCLASLGYKPNADLDSDTELLITSAAGAPFVQRDAVRMSLKKRVTIICGHYLGVDERILELFPIREVSIGDYTLTGGEPAASVMLDAICRLIPGALGNFSSAQADSHQEGILGAPVFTRPEEFMGLRAPAELLSGDHKKVAEYRRKQALAKTKRCRPELLEKEEIQSRLSDEDVEYLERITSITKQK